MSDAIEELARDLWDAWQATVGCPESARGISWETIREGAGRANAAGQRYHAMALSEAATLVTLGYHKAGPDHVVVPREPTEAMVKASRLSMRLPTDRPTARVVQWGTNAWDAMITAYLSEIAAAGIPTSPDPTTPPHPIREEQ